jgi:dTMP kinase
VKAFGPLAEAVLFSAARADHLDSLIRPALARGAFVLCDRFADSTRAYQGVLGSLDPGLIRALERAAVGDTRPDLTLVLDAPAEVGLARASSRRGRERADRFEAEEGSFHERIRRAFLEVAAAEPDRCAVVDAARPPEAVEEDVWFTVEARLLRDSATPSATGSPHGR